MSCLVSSLLIFGFVLKRHFSHRNASNLLLLFRSVVDQVYHVKNWEQDDAMSEIHGLFCYATKEYLSKTDRCIRNRVFFRQNTLTNPIIIVSLNCVQILYSVLTMGFYVSSCWKRFIEYSWTGSETKNHNAHITVVEQDLFRDWMFRVRTIIDMTTPDNVQQEKLALWRLRCLMQGDAVCPLDPSTAPACDFFIKMDKSLQDFETDPIWTQILKVQGVHHGK